MQRMIRTRDLQTRTGTAENIIAELLIKQHILAQNSIVICRSHLPGRKRKAAPRCQTTYGGIDCASRFKGLPDGHSQVVPR